MKMNEIDDRLFNRLKYLCAKCVSERITEPISNLNDFVTKIEPSFIDGLHVYVCFPLRLIISKMQQTM